MLPFSLALFLAQPYSIPKFSQSRLISRTQFHYVTFSANNISIKNMFYQLGICLKTQFHLLNKLLCFSCTREGCIGFTSKCIKIDFGRPKLFIFIGNELLFPLGKTLYHKFFRIELYILHKWTKICPCRLISWQQNLSVTNSMK